MNRVNDIELVSNIAIQKMIFNDNYIYYKKINLFLKRVQDLLNCSF